MKYQLINTNIQHITTHITTHIALNNNSKYELLIQSLNATLLSLYATFQSLSATFLSLNATLYFVYFERYNVIHGVVVTVFITEDRKREAIAMAERFDEMCEQLGVRVSHKKKIEMVYHRVLYMFLGSILKKRNLYI